MYKNGKIRFPVVEAIGTAPPPATNLEHGRNGTATNAEHGRNGKADIAAPATTNSRDGTPPDRFGMIAVVGAHTTGSN